RDDMRLERHEGRDAANLGIGVGIRPRCLARVANRVIAAEPLVRAERLEFHRRESGRVNVVAWNVPARRKSGLVEDQRPLGIGDDPVALADYEVAGGLANVDAMVGIRGMAEDTFVFLVESVHGAPGERNVSLQFAGVRGQAGVLPRSSRSYMLLVRSHAIPGAEPEIRMLSRIVGLFQ